MPAHEYNSVPRGIAWHADHTPTSVAIVSDQHQITYRRLTRDLARCAQFMRDANVASRLLVGLPPRRDVPPDQIVRAFVTTRHE
jgi:hypothetical protein